MAKAKKRTESAALGSASAIDTPPDTAQAAETAGGEHRGRDRVAMRAYELYLARGGADGGDFDDWLAAEREIGGSNGNSSPGDAGE